MLEERTVVNPVQNFSLIFGMILFSRLLFFLLLAVSCPQTENTRSTYASDARADSRFWTSGANSGYIGIRDPVLKSNVF